VSGSARDDAAQEPSSVSARIERLHELFRREFKIEVPSAETDLLGEGLLDSLQLIELLLHLEAEFHMSISFDALEVEDFQCLRSIAELLAGRKGVTPAPESIRRGIAPVRQ
jgi:acyl carrier protein